MSVVLRFSTRGRVDPSFCFVQLVCFMNIFYCIVVVVVCVSALVLLCVMSARALQFDALSWRTVFSENRTDPEFAKGGRTIMASTELEPITGSGVESFCPFSYKRGQKIRI